MFEGNFVEMCTAYFPLMLIGEKETVKRAQMGSEDPYWPEQTLFYNSHFLIHLNQHNNSHNII